MLNHTGRITANELLFKSNLRAVALLNEINYFNENKIKISPMYYNEKVIKLPRKEKILNWSHPEYGKISPSTDLVFAPDTVLSASLTLTGS